MIPDWQRIILPTVDYDLDATLSSGQAFRWRKTDDRWEGVIGRQMVRLYHRPRSIVAETSSRNPDWEGVQNYLQVGVNLEIILSTFPTDALMQKAINCCRGLRLLRQDPWECLASFILSSTKQIVQIEQIIDLLCSRYGESLGAGARGKAFSFPTPERLAACTEKELRACKMGFRAPYLRVTASLIASGKFSLAEIKGMSLEKARAQILKLPGVGPKIADCVLLFAYGFSTAFPIDVWVAKALQKIYFRRRPRNLSELQVFVQKYFGPQAGYAQQYLFHYMRVASRNVQTEANF